MDKTDLKRSQLARIFDPDNQFYHGSRGGLDGRIDPTRGRVRTDFGQGFYMQTSQKQAKAWVVHDTDPVLYGIDADLSAMADSTLVLTGREWLFTVMHNRRNCDAFNGTELDRALDGFLDGFDFVIGPIADDRLNDAVTLFANNALTDEGLFECLVKVPFGVQVVAKTEKACSMLHIAFEQRVYGAEADSLLEYANQRKAEGRKAYAQVQSQFKGRGLYLSELLEIGPAQLDLQHKVPDKNVLFFDSGISPLKPRQVGE